MDKNKVNFVHLWLLYRNRKKEKTHTSKAAEIFCIKEPIKTSSELVWGWPDFNIEFENK